MKMKPNGYSKTAILIFANSPEEESRRKSLLHGTELFTDIMARTLSEVKKTGFDYFHIDEHHQRGVDFGNRFLNAIEDVFDKGYQYLIAIGADIPRISGRQILSAIDELHKGQLVIGPSTDGGFYLIGLHRSQFLKQEMIQLPWQKSGLRSQLVAKLERKGLNINVLKALADIDTTDDLEGFTRGDKNIPYSIFKQLQLVTERRSISEFALEKQFETAVPLSYYNKGSPVIRLLIS